MTDTALCPFCVSDDIFIARSGDTEEPFGWVECGICEASGPMCIGFTGEQQILDAWNNRSSEIPADCSIKH